MAAASSIAETLSPILSVRSLPPSLAERWLPSLGLAAASLVCLASPALAAGLAPWPFLLAAVVLGLPHGAADGTVLLRGLPWPRRLSRIAGYLALMALATAALLRFPTAALLGFLALSWWHFGAADGAGLATDRAPVWLRRAWSFGRGGLAVAVPFAADPTAAWAPFARLAELLGTAALVDVAWLGRTGTAAAAATLLALALSATAPRAVRPRAPEWVESGLILGLGLAADPLFTVGAYFLLVHGFRQSASLGKELSPGRATRPSLWSRLLACHRASLPLLVPSWLALLALALSADPAGARDVAILSLILYVVATPPHHLFQEMLPE